MVLLFLLFILFIIGLAIVGTAFWIWMLVDCAQNRGLTSDQKLVWILIIVFTHFIGALIYLFAGRPARNQPIYQQPFQAPYQPYQPSPQGYQPPPQGYQPNQPPPQSYQPYQQGHPYQQPPQGQPYQQGYQMQKGSSYRNPEGTSIPSQDQYEHPTASYPEQSQES